MRMFFIFVVIVVSVATLLITALVMRLLAKRKQVINGFGTIDAQLKRRQQLVDELAQLTETKQTAFDDALQNLQFLNTQARSVRSPTEREHFENALSASLAQFLVAAKGTEEYTTCPQFAELVNNLRGVENDLRRWTNFYNEVAEKYNAAVESAPARYVAPMFCIEPQPLLRFDFAQAKCDLHKPHYRLGAAPRPLAIGDTVREE